MSVPRLFYTIGVIPGQGRPNVFVSRTINYTSIDDSLSSLTHSLLSPPLSQYIPVPEPTPDPPDSNPLPDPDVPNNE